MNKIMGGRSTALFALLTTLVLALTACGGGSSSASGGGGGTGATIAGTVDNGVAMIHPAYGGEHALLAFSDVFVQKARASGIAGVTVELLDGTSTVIATTTTDASGDFLFTSLAPGNYTIRLSQGGTPLGETPSVQVDSNTKTNIKLSLNGGVTSVEVEGEGNQISGDVSQGSNDNATGDNSGTDNSAENDSGDDSSADNGTEDDNDTENDNSGGSDNSEARQQRSSDNSESSNNSGSSNDGQDGQNGQED